MTFCRSRLSISQPTAMLSKQLFQIAAIVMRLAGRALLAALGTLVLLSGTSQAQSIIHEFYVPMPEAQVRTALVAIEPASGIVGTTMESVVSIVATGTGTVIHYDQWEDGYEVDLNHPTQPTTKIWGDGNNANGIPPGYANDPASLTSGSVVNLRNQITLPRNPATILYDGRDRFGGTKALVVTRTGWAVAPGTVLAGSVEVTATMDYGTQYITPVGQDVTASSMFEVVGLMVMARENGTSVTVDLNGPVGGGATTVTLNQGESHLVSSGVLKGATVNSTKPVQVQLITGDIGARFETDWFTLYPVDQWTGTYYSPVGTASDGDAAFGFFYNPTAATITINVTTCFGSGSFNVPAYGVYQYQMPQNCGAKFISTGEIPFFGIVMVGANPTANNVHDWGFTLVPSDSLTTEAVVGWGPGSSDLTQNGSPVWVTPIGAVRVYVDYNGDRLGPLTDPRGNKYDVHYDMAALETRRLFDPDKDQSAMRVYTLDGIQIAAAWGQDPATAGPGNPFLDVGTTVLPFPVPTLIKTHSLTTDVAPVGLSIGDTIEYRIDVDNKGLLPLGNLLVLDPLHASLTYQAGTSKRDGNAISDDGVGSTIFPLDEAGYLIPIILRGGSTTFTYRCTINAAGSIANTAMNTNYNLTSTENVVVPPPAGSTPCGAQFTNAAGVLQSTYSAGSLVYGTLTDPDANNNAAAVEVITIVVNNTSNGDAEFVSLTETGINTGIFRNTAGLPTSTISGTLQMDGTLLVAPGNGLSFTYTDPEFSETCTGVATISVPTQNKYLYLSDPAQALDRVDPVATSDVTTAQTAVLGPVGGAIAVDATSSSQSANASSRTFAHTIGTGDNRLLLVAIAVGATSSTGTSPTVTSVTYDGNPLTLVGSRVSGSGGVNDDAISYIYRLIAPASGTANVVVNLSGAGSITVGATSFNNVHQTTPLGAYTSNSNTSGTASVVTTSAADEVVFSTAAWDEGYTITVAGGQTSLWNLTTTGPLSGAASTKPGAASVTSTFTGSASDQDWAVSGVSIKPAPAGGSPTATFIQAPTFASAFTLPIGSAPTVTAHYTVATGTMPPSPTITAALKKGVTTLATSTGTTASAATGSGVFTFTFASLGSAVNFASTEALTLVITTTQTGTTFTVDYDSSTKPSKITLPTTTVINVDSLGVYDAPYPGGSLITGPASGSTAYVRSVVSDPFGAYDITSLGLNIDGPGAPGDITTTLTAPNVVNTGTGTKTYEYAWTVGSTTGTYNIAVTANEGTEGIQATRATSVNVTFLDLGTPSVTEFTTGSNGPGTSTYAGNEQVFVRITDLDQNLNAAVAETITATITSLAGDSELVTLTETGVNTGIFVVGIPASTAAPNTFNNGTLHAVLGDVLTVNYVDPTDSTDTGSDTATIPNIAPAISVNKTLVMPADGQAVIGEALQYTVQVTNTGNTTLSTISLVDTFPTADLTFVNASVTPNSIVPAGTLTWNNVGTLTPGQSTTITLNFTALTTAAPAVNTATADAGGGTTGGDTANVTITDPDVTITKTLLSPNPGPANIGDNVVFRIAVQNTGDTAIATLPIEDTYSGADFDFISATVAPDASGSGSLLWLDVTGAGTLAPAATITIDVTLQAVGAAAPASNLAAANYTVDVNGDSAPPVNSSATITLIAATIRGHVYDDANTNSAYNPPGDSPLEGITVSLYTDPNGDGNPADGTLIDITVTDVSGLYEFLNLPAGNYVVVESQPPGYSSHSDTVGANDNRIPLVISTLTTFANNDFFDFLTPLVSYASVAGKVWNDANASATVNGGEVGISNVAVDLVEDTNNNGSADLGEPVTASTLTATDGTYSFGGLSAGNYVIVEHDLFNWYSTADSAAPNNNQIPVTLSAGQNATGKDFLDVLTGTTGGKVFHDVNGNGSFDGGDVALAGIDVLITDFLGATQTVVTDASGNWTATLPPGLTTIDVQQVDPQFTAVFAPAYGQTQTAGTDSSTVTVVSGVNTPAGDDGFRQVGTITGHAYVDTNGDGDQDVGEPNLANVDVIITHIVLTTQTVTTNASGDWTASVPPGLTTVNIDNADPQFTALVLAGFHQTEGTDPSTVTAIANTSTDAGTDGFYNPTTISGSVFADIDDNDTPDDPIGGVTVKLFSDPNGDGDPADGVEIDSTVTDLGGIYIFTDQPPGDYVVVQSQPVGYLSVTDGDTTTSGDDVANASTPDNRIPVSVIGGETDDGNAFIEEQPGSISGFVLADTNNNNTGDIGIQNVTLTLLDFSGTPVDGDPNVGGVQLITAITDINGAFTFNDVPPGEYRIGETQPAGYQSISDSDGGNIDQIANVTVFADMLSDGYEFVEEQLGEIRGTVSVGASPQQNVVMTLFTDPNGDGNPADGAQLGSTVLTNAAGLYIFTSVAPGAYVVLETQPSGYVSVSDADTTTPGDDAADAGADNRIPVGIAAGELDDGNNFIESCPAITVNPVTLPNGTVGTAYGQTLSATGGTAPYTFAVTTGSLPAGLSLVSGAITGTPGSPDSETFTITATDSLGCEGARSYTVSTSCPVITVNPASLPDATVGVAYNQTLSATGGTAAYTFAVTSGALPAGFTLTGDTISGTPTTAATANFTITATDSLGCTGSRALTITSACPAITVSPTSLPNGIVGTAYNQTITAGGGTAAYTFAVTSGTLPAGLSLASGGELTGTPTSTTSQTFTITATDANSCTGARSFTIAPVCPTISLASIPVVLPGGTVGVAYSGSITASGGTSAYAFAVKIGSALPPGLVISSAGAISGTPTTNGTTNTIIVATDAHGCAGEATFTINVGCNTLTITPNTIGNGVVGAAYTPVVFNQTGGTGVITWTQTGTLPAGMTFNTGTHTLGGTPTEAGNWTITVTATDQNTCAGSVNLSFSTACPAITVNPTSLPNGIVGTAYSEQLTATGGTVPHTFAVTSGTLPAGLTLAGDTISGTPTSTTSQMFTITATDDNGCEGTRVFTVAPVCPAITVNPATLPNGVVGTAYSEVLTATGGTAAYSFAVTSGALPAGLNLAAGVISGTPTATAVANFTITATDTHGCTGTRSFTLTPTCPVITVNPASLPAAIVGTSYNQVLTANGGTAAYTYVVTSGSLPAGLSLAAGVITGTPTDTVSESFTITATDAHGCNGARSFTLAPTCPVITVNPTALPAAVVGTVYSSTLSATGGTAPFAYAVTTGVLPAGLTLVGDTISGTPTSTASQTFTITVTDDYDCSGTRVFTLAPTCPTISLSSTPAVLSSGTIGVAYSGTIQATGGTAAYTFAVKVGSSLPPGLSINSAGVISGTPTINGTTNTIIVSTDAHGCQGEATFTINIGCNTLVVTPASVSSGVVGTAYTPVTFNAAGGTGVITWTHTGALPAGMTFSSAGVLSGTPTEAGAFAITFIGTDQNTCAGNVNLTLNTSCPVITVNPASLPNGVIGTPYNQTMSASDGTAPYTYAVTSGTLPAGLNLAAGVISGTPTSTAAASFTITATDTHGCTGARAFTVTPVCPVITVNPASLPNPAIRTAYTQTLSVTGGTAPHTFALTSGALPTGLTLTGDTISGTPTVAASSTFTITATDDYGCEGSRSFTLTVLTGTISGHLYIDTNGDGNQDGGEPNLPNVSMEITESGGAVQTVSSDSSGNWTATVPPGDTSSNVDENDSDFGLLVLPGYSQTDGSDQTTGVIVIAGGNVDGGTDGYFNPAFVAGHLYLDLNSNGTQDPGEDNLVDVTVIVTDFEGNMQPAFTDVDGNWQASVPPGTTTVDVDESDPEFQALVLAGYIQTEGDDPTVVTVTGGGMTSAGNDGYFNPATLSGTVFADTDNDGDGDNALENAQVALFTDPNGDGDPADGVQAGLPVLTDSSGVYTFSGITYGDYVIVLLPITDYLAVVDGDTTDAADDHSNVSTTDRRIPVSAMAAEADDGNDFVEEQSASIGNLVWNDTDNDGIKDGGESGLDGVVVELRDGSGNPIDSDSGTSGVQPTITTTSGGGLYSFAGLAPGSYRLVISTPPAAQPMSSTTTSTADNHVEGDDNGTQAMATAPVTSPVIALGAGEVENTLDFGFTTVTGSYSITGQVRDDYDLDGSFSDNDKPVPNVTVQLYADTNGNGSYDPGTDLLIETTTTTGLGQYTFGNLPDGTYFVIEADPNPSASTADTDGPNDNLIKVVISGASSTGNDFLDAVDPAGYIYHSVTGEIIAGGSISVSGPGAINVLMDGSTGQYSFVTDSAGTYTITFTPPLGYMIDPLRPVAGASFDPTPFSDPHSLGSGEDAGNPGHLTNFSAAGNPYYLTFDLAPGDPFVINNNIPVIEIKPTTFAAWQYVNPLGGQNGATQDPDGDGLTNLEEFAFCYNPATGINGGCPLEIVKNLDGSIDARVRRVTNASGITYQLEYIANLAGSGANGAGWTNLTTITPTIALNPGGVETATYADLASIPVLSLGQGFVRVKVTRISDSTVARSEVAGWATRALILGCQTCSVPFLKCEIFSGAVDGVAGSSLNLTASVGTGNLAGNFTVGREYYVEVISGDHEGQRFEVNEAASTITAVAIDTSSPRNTLGSTIPATLAADRIVVREHLRMKDLFAPADFTHTNSPSTADRLLFHNKNTGAFQVYWLYTNGVGGPKWVDVADAGLLDSGNRAVDVCEGFFVHLKGHPATFVFTGHVRSNRMACPLVADANLLGNGWPLDMSPTTRRMRLIDGFIGAASSSGADRVQFWSEDDDSSASGYTGHFLLNAGSLQRWVGQADASLLNENSANLFNMLRAHFSQPRTPRPNYVIPNPWIP